MIFFYFVFRDFVNSLVQILCSGCRDITASATSIIKLREPLYKALDDLPETPYTDVNAASISLLSLAGQNLRQRFCPATVDGGITYDEKTRFSNLQISKIDTPLKMEMLHKRNLFFVCI